jgi:hypothetical protein
MVSVVRYCTPEWLEAAAKAYASDPRFQQALKSLSVRVCFLVRAEPAWGIEEDILFGAFLRQGELERLGFFSAGEAKGEAEYILGATPQQWKTILRKDSKFITDFMLGRIALEQGSKVGVLAIAPHANTFVEILTQTDIQFPDEMSPQELEAYRTDMANFRRAQGV